VSGGIYLVRGDDELVEMRETPYEAEDVLQLLIARFPSLLAGDQFGGETARRWLLVGREASLPDDEDAAGRWSVDHLFLDQDAVPTLVEVKRSSDTRIRREIVGQMLDYAANGVVYWPLEQLRELFVRQCERDNREPDEVAQEVAGNDVDVEEWWQRAGDNLPALGPADVPQTRFRKGLEADAPDRNRTSARGLGSRSTEASVVRLCPLCPFGTGSTLH
jgi:hypothetical protein